MMADGFLVLNNGWNYSGKKMKLMIKVYLAWNPDSTKVACDPFVLTSPASSLPSGSPVRPPGHSHRSCSVPGTHHALPPSGLLLSPRPLLRKLYPTCFPRLALPHTLTLREVTCSERHVLSYRKWNDAFTLTSNALGLSLWGLYNIWLKFIRNIFTFILSLSSLLKSQFYDSGGPSISIILTFPSG